MKIYTKTGDQGETGLFGGGRVSKDHIRIEAYGTVDELNAVLGMVRAQLGEKSVAAKVDPAVDHVLAKIQNDLFTIGAELATANAEALAKITVIKSAGVELLERTIDSLQQGLEPLRQFVLPGGSSSSALLHLARTVCRRAERRVITLSAQREESVSPVVVVYLNRLSDLLFVMARAANSSLGVADVAWQQD